MGEAITGSFLYDCETMHQRLLPRKHGFRYGLFYFYIDLDEVCDLAKKHFFFGHNSFNLFSFYDEDHLDLGEGDLRANLKRWLSEQGTPLPEDHRVHLLTMPRILGYIFNPVCFYFIRTAEGKMKHVVVEVCNTYRELKPWLIDSPDSRGTFSLRAPKHFYVSPFSDLTDDFVFRVRVPSDRLEIDIDTFRGNERILASWLHGSRRPFTTASLLRLFFKYPLLTVQVVTKIHWQALKLWARKFKVRKKSAQAEHQRELFRPYRPKP